MKTKIITSLIILLTGWVTLKGQNLLINGDFELSPPDGSTVSIGWKTGWYPSQAGSVTTSTAAMAGNCGLWIYTSDAQNESFSRPYQEIRCTPGTRYKAEAYLRTPKDEKWSSGSSAYISLTFKTSSGVSIQTLYSDKLTTRNPDWRLFTIDVVSPEKSALVRYTVNIVSTKLQSVANVDNCSLTVVR